MEDNNEAVSIPRKLIVLFDGTNMNYGKRSNIARFRDSLEEGEDQKDGSETQLIHYEPGVGAAEYDGEQTAENLNLQQDGKLRRLADLMFAHSLKKHLLSVYKFLLDNYKTNDKIYIFEYSRGAHLARALAGMLYKVGLVPGENQTLVNAAYGLYERKDRDGWALCELFRNAQTLSPDIEFMGLWDTVSAVGAIRQHLPFTRVSSATNIRVFRHAVCLDERRARFSPDLYKPPSKWLKNNEKRKSKQWQQVEIEREFRKKRANQTNTNVDVREMWFAGCHSDVGGSTSDANANYSLSRIALRWMINQCYEAQTGLRFKDDELRKYGLDPEKLRSHPEQLQTDPQLDDDMMEKAVDELLRSYEKKHGRGDPSPEKLKEMKKAIIDSEKTYSESQGRPQASSSAPTAVEQTMQQIAEVVISMPELPPDLLDALTPMHDCISWRKFYWVLLGVRHRNPEMPIQLHPTVELREKVLQWALDRNRDESIKIAAKQLGLRRYKSIVTRKAKKNSNEGQLAGSTTSIHVAQESIVVDSQS